MFEDIDEELNKEFITQCENGLECFHTNAPLQAIGRVSENKTEHALNWVMKQVMNEGLPPETLGKTELMRVLKKVPEYALVKVKLCWDKTKQINNYRTFCVDWNPETNEGIMVYIPNTTSEKLEEEIYKNDF